MKIFKSKCKKKKKKKKKIDFDSIKNSFWVHKVSGIKILFPNSHKKLSVGFWKKKAHFTSPPLWKFLSPNVTAKPPPKIHLLLIQSKIPFECTKSLALDAIHKISQKKLSSSFLKKVHFNSPHMWKFLSPRVTTKPPKIHLILI